MSEAFKLLTVELQYLRESFPTPEVADEHLKYVLCQRIGEVLFQALEKIPCTLTISGPEGFNEYHSMQIQLGLVAVEEYQRLKQAAALTSANFNLRGALRAADTEDLIKELETRTDVPAGVLILGTKGSVWK
jgi:hypothetical protein